MTVTQLLQTSFLMLKDKIKDQRWTLFRPRATNRSFL